MIIIKTTKPLHCIITAFKATFASKPHPPHSSHHYDVQKTKFNPLREKDLRGYQHFQQLTQNQKSYSAIHSQEYHPLSCYGIFSLLNNSLARFMGRLVSHPRSVISSDSLYLPKIWQSSIPIYDSIDKASKYLTLNKLISIVSPLSILLFAIEPTLSLISYSFLFALYYHGNWKNVRHLVIKCELLPNKEEIVYQKITIWGTILTKKVKISDLQYLSYEQIFKQNNLSQRSVRGLINRQLAFRIQDSKQLLLFDKSGFWNEEGINHDLLY